AGEWGVYPSFVVDASTFVFSALLISRINYRRVEADEGADRSVAAALREYVGGLRYIWRYRDIMVIAMQKAAVSLVVSGAFQVIQVTLAERIFVIGEAGGTSLGIMYAAVGVGTGLGPILARLFTRDRGRALRVAIAISYAVTAAGLAIMAPLSSFPVVLLGILLRGVGNGVSWVFSTQLLLQILPDRVRGRVFSTEFAMFTLTNAISSAGAGLVLDSPQVDVSLMLWWMAALTLLPGLLWVAWLIFGEHATPEPVGEPTGEPRDQAPPESRQAEGSFTRGSRIQRH
ncbi:MAG TPA: MFS transporter, partial [Candidatus Binatia bacterium]|nr:MFS transporter [Candidatus Binatia bacterium]